MPQDRMIRFCAFYRGRVAKSTALNWVKLGLLKTYKVGGLTYVDVTFDEFVRQAAKRLADNKAA